MRNYELTLLFKADAAEGRAQGLLAEIASMLQDHGAIVISQDAKGKRALPVPIQKQTAAELAVLRFNLDPAKVEDVEKNLKTKDALVRFTLLSYLPRKARELSIARPAAAPLSRQAQEEQKVELQDIDKKLEEIFKDDNL